MFSRQAVVLQMSLDFLFAKKNNLKTPKPNSSTNKRIKKTIFQKDKKILEQSKTTFKDYRT